MRRVIFRRMRFSRIKQEERNITARKFLVQLIECRDFESAHGARDGAGHDDNMALAAKVAQPNYCSIQSRRFKVGSQNAGFWRHRLAGIQRRRSSGGKLLVVVVTFFVVHSVFRNKTLTRKSTLVASAHPSRSRGCFAGLIVIEPEII